MSVEIFIDTANVAEIKRWLQYGVIDGVTTNPSIMLKDGAYDAEARAREIAALVEGRPVSLEVTTNDPVEMFDQAITFAQWAPNIVVKIPTINENGEPCLGVVKSLEEKGVRVNVTAIMSFGQLALAAKTGATYASVFAGRISDEGHDASRLIAAAVAWLERWHYKTRLIVGSIRGAIDIQNAALGGAHIITIPPAFLTKMADHKYTRETVRGFVHDAMQALLAMERTQSEEKAAALFTVSPSMLGGRG
jgi:transaldolase